MPNVPLGSISLIGLFPQYRNGFTSGPRPLLSWLSQRPVHGFVPTASRPGTAVELSPVARLNAPPCGSKQAIDRGALARRVRLAQKFAVAGKLPMVDDRRRAVAVNRQVTHRVLVVGQRPESVAGGRRAAARPRSCSSASN